MTEGLLQRQQRRALGFSRQLAERDWYHSFELPDGTRIEGLQKLEAQKNRYAEFPIPEDLSGKTVLDIGAWDGWFSFEAERRGAQVTAVDCVEVQNFLEMRARLSSRVDYRILDLYELPEAGLGKFDYVFFLGVLYHVKHPLLALEIVCGLTRQLAIVDSFVVDGDTWMDHSEALPWMEFYETDELCGQLDNWFGPSVECLRALSRAAGFARVELISARSNGAVVACNRFWEPEPANPRFAPPVLTGVANSRNFGINFSCRKEEYVTCWFHAPQQELSRNDVRIEVDGFGLPAFYLKALDSDGWMVSCRLPPGLQPGWKPIRLRTSRSAFSSPLRIAVDIPPHSDHITVKSVWDGLSWRENEVKLAEQGMVSLWVKGLPENCDRHNVRVDLGANRLDIEFIGPPDETDARQINACVRRDIAKGQQQVTVSCGEARSESHSITVV